MYCKHKAATYLVTSVLTAIPAASFADGEQGVMEQASEETTELMQTLKSLTAEQKREAFELAEKGVLAIDNRIDRLEQRVDRHWNAMTTSAKLQARDDIKALREDQARLEKAYGAWRNSSSDAWDALQAGFTEAYRELDEAWQDAEQAFRENHEPATS